MKLIIGISGKMGSGKDFITENYILPIFKQFNIHPIIISFADQLKIQTMIKYNFSYDELYVNKTTESRKILQFEGTENSRNILGNDIWIRYLDKWIDIYSNRNFNVFIITDVRFKNEYNYIRKNNGIVIKVISPNRNKQRLLKESNNNIEVYNQLQTHLSECDLDNISDKEFDLVINNDDNYTNEGTSDKLQNLVTNLLTNFDLL